MATPFLMMASTEPPNLVLSYEQHMNRNNNTHKSSSENPPLVKKQRAKSSKSKSPTTTTTKKKAQRGMGIDKLERLRIQDRLKKLSDPVQFNHPLSSSSSSVFQVGHNGNYDDADKNENGSSMNLEQFLMFNKRSCFNGSGRVLDPRSGNVVETSAMARELSSIQNMECVPDACFKKKRANAEDSGLISSEEIIKTYCESSWMARNPGADYFHGLNHGNNNADHFRNPNRSTAFTRVTPRQNKEIRANHRNESSSMGSGGNNIFMEYDFLSSHNKSQFSVSPNIEDFRVATTAAATFNNDTTVDLSLKL